MGDGLEAHLRVAGHDRVFCVGDAAAKPPDRVLASYAHGGAGLVAFS